MPTRSSTSLLDALAEALAATLARKPLLAAAALALSIPIFGDIVWGAAAAFVAAALVARSLPREPDAGRASDGLFWSAFTCLPLTVVLLVAAGVAHQSRFGDWATVLSAAAAVGAAPRSTRARMVGVAVLVPSWVGSLHTRDAAPVHRLLAGPVLTTLTIALLATAYRRAGRLLLLPVAAAAVWFAEMTDPRSLGELHSAISTPGLERGLLGAEVALVIALTAVAALVAGAVGHAVSRGPLPDAATRCVVALRRSPWKTSLLIALLALVLGANRSAEYRADPLRLFVVAAMPAAVLLGALARAAPSSIDVLAPVAAASSLACVSSLSLNSLADRGPFAPLGYVVASTAVLWTFVVSWLFDDERVLRSFRVWGWWALVVVACALALPDADPALRLTALALIPLVIAGLVSGTAPARSIFMTAIAFGLTCSAALALQRSGSGPRRTWGLVFLDEYPGIRIVSSVWWPLALSLAVALAALAARRLRSMTVVPRDHPILEDFGGEERSLRAGDVTSGPSGGPIA